LNRVFTTADLYDEHSAELAVAAPGLVSYGGYPRFCGRVLTVTAPEDNSRVVEALSKPGDGGVLIVDAGGSMSCAVLGDQLAARAAENGWAGVIVWGCIRDSVIVGKTQLGVFALGTHPARTVKRDLGEHGLDVSFLGVTIHPGDWVFADEDGLLIAATDLLAAD
jgi:regulator of ribonuclease activity A